MTTDEVFKMYTDQDGKVTCFHCNSYMSKTMEELCRCGMDFEKVIVANEKVMIKQKQMFEERNTEHTQMIKKEKAKFVRDKYTF